MLFNDAASRLAAHPVVALKLWRHTPG